MGNYREQQTLQKRRISDRIRLLKSAVEDDVLPDSAGTSRLNREWKLLPVPEPVEWDKCQPFTAMCGCGIVADHPPDGRIVSMGKHLLRHSEKGYMVAWIGDCGACGAVLAAISRLREEWHDSENDRE